MTSIYCNHMQQFEPRARQFMDDHPQDDGADDDNLGLSILSSAPRLVTKSSTIANSSKVKSDDIWTIREIPNGGEEELYAKGKCVYHMKNSLIIKTFNFTNQVVKVFWLQFNQSCNASLISNKDYICVALNSGLSIFNKLGQHFQIPLPFTYQDLYPSKLGLLIERNCDSSADQSSLPTLFALAHPSKEISPILFKPKSTNQTLVTYSTPSFLTIVACSDHLPLCLTYNSQDCQHSIWRIRTSTDDEISKFQQMNEQQDQSTTVNTTAFTNQSCSFREGLSQASLSNLSNRQKSNLFHQSNQSSLSNNLNYSPKIDTKRKNSALGNLAASRLGIGSVAPLTSETVINTTNLRSFNSVHTMNMLSTPNKNRIINYLRDNIEEPILPDLTLEQLWIEPATNSLKGNKFFNTSDFSNQNYLVIVTKASTQLKVIKCDNLEVDNCARLEFGRVTFITASDASPIPNMNMMIVVDNNKNFVLYSGFDRITQINVPLLSSTAMRNMPNMSSPAQLKHSNDSLPIQTSSARKRLSIGDRSISSDSSIQQMFQALSPVPHTRHESKISAPISLSDIKIEHVIGNSVFVINSNSLHRIRFDIPPICQTKCIEKLMNSMKALVSKELALNLTIKWYQTRRSSSEPELLNASGELRLFKNWFLNSIGVGCNFFTESKTENASFSFKFIHSSPTKKTKRNKDIESNPMVSNIYALFYAMHLVFEDLLLSKLNYSNAIDVAELLIVLACILNLDEYQEYYWLKFPVLQKKFGTHKEQLENLIPNVSTLYRPPFFKLEPPSVIDFFCKVISKSQSCDSDYDESLNLFPYIPKITDNIHTVISLICEMFSIDRNKAMLPISSITDLKEGDSTLELEEYRPMRSPKADEKFVQLMVDLGKDRNYLSRLPAGINIYFWDAILNCLESPPTGWNEACYNLIGRIDLVSLVRGCGKTNRSGENTKNHDDDISRLIFPDDIRVSEASRMLVSDTQVEFSVSQRQGATEEESREETLRQLSLLNIRTMAMSVGRGALCLRTYSPVIGESFEVPKLELTGKFLNEDRQLEFPHDVSVYPWPFFHNGVAAGLTICASTAYNIIDSTWINYNRPRSNIPHSPDVRERDLTSANINNEHAGFLFALGLNGHLEKLSLMALHDYLCQNNDLTKLAILLGMSAAKRGSKDNNIIKVLSIHVDALLPPNSTELDVSAPVHVASIIGVGLLYQGSGDSHISKVLLDEIGRSPGPETNSHVDRESYSLSAGLAFGLVNLCKGGSTTITSSDQLRLYMLGGKRKTLTHNQKDRYFKQDCHRGEEEYINTHITSPGGTLGLGLMYHRSNNQSVANWMKAPDTQTLLEYVRPDLLILRMLSHGLIMWDEIKPSEEWINSQIPKIISTHAFQRNSVTSAPRLVASSASKGNIDYELISQAYCNIVAGCCMSIAMRYAGTSDKNAYKTIYKHTKMLIALSNKPILADQAGRPCIEACLNVLVTSLAVIMAGTGNLGVMRVCRYLRSRLSPSCAFYGSYMAIHIALGILFMGSCRYSLNTSADSISALVCALYPIYPTFSSCNRYHLQALRHLYVLAAEPRLIIPRDILTNKPVYVKITVKQREDNATGQITELKLKAPCLVPEVESIESIHVDDDRYWCIIMNDKDALKRCLFQNQGCLSVKRKAHSSNNQLVNDLKSLVLERAPQGVEKTRKTAALLGCVKEDRVEQYSALNELLTKTKTLPESKFVNLMLEQIRLASHLSDSIEDKVASLKSVIHKLDVDLANDGVEEKWLNYLSKKTDWTNSDEPVARYICLNDLHIDRNALQEAPWLVKILNK